jgi:hypothetical protein
MIGDFDFAIASYKRRRRAGELRSFELSNLKRRAFSLCCEEKEITF